MPRRRLTAHQKRIVAARSEWRCARCGEMLDETYEIDHVVALSLGGDDTVENCEALHAKCHREKTLRDEIERIERNRRAKLAGRRPPLKCEGCGLVVSPFFLHKCKVTSSEDRPAS